MLWVKHNIAEAVAEYFTEEIGRSDAMLLIKSDILKHIGKMKIELIEETAKTTRLRPPRSHSRLRAMARALVWAIPRPPGGATYDGA